MITEPIIFVLERMSDLIKYEARILLVDEKKEINGLKHELELIESYLKDVDEVERIETINHVLKTKVQHLMQILPEIEDFLDKITDQKARQIKPSFSQNIKAFFSCSSNPLILKHHFVEETTGIKEYLIDTLRRPEGYRLPNNYPQVTYRRRLPTTSSIIRDEIFIGLEEDVNSLVAKFVGESGANSAIVGMGGSGKTTLAKKFYNHEEIKEAFPRRAWVCVSQEWNARDLLVQICAMLGVVLSEDERPIARVKLEEFLEGSLTLVVLDDVWERNALQELLPSLLSGNGRVLITTRKEKIVKFQKIGAFYIHRARRLTIEESWELFFKIVCNSHQGMKYNFENADFAKLGREMLEKCDGLPLAIITLAGILGTKDTIQQWEDIKDDVIPRIMGDDSGPLGHEEIKKVLELSYFDLPYHLKPCFLYLGTFKEDEEIEADLLINLWMDEGFIRPDQCPEPRRLNEVAKNFLDDLIQRCMVQVVYRNYAGDIKYIRIHDLMRDLCIHKANELGFFQVLSPSNTSTIQIKPPYRRAILHDNPNRKSVVLDHSRLRTLICINDSYGGSTINDVVTDSIPKQLFPFEMLKQVRVLSLQSVQIGDSLQQIGNMVLLRYLRLWYCSFTTRNVEFPNKLRNLQTFIFFGGSLELSDNMFGSTEQLRVLYLVLINGCASPGILLGVEKLRKLQTLNVSADEWIVKELHFTSIDLRDLNIYGISSQQQMDAIYGCVNRTSTRLETLELYLERSEQLEIDFEKMKLEMCGHLKSLQLHGKIRKQQEDYSWLLPSKLVLLTLYRSEVEEEEDMNQVFAQLDHLRELTLAREAYKGARLTLTGLPQLQKLSLKSLSCLKEYIITQGSVPQLRELEIIGCPILDRVSDGLSNIKSLQLLMVRSMPRRFWKRIKRKLEGSSDGGEDFHLVQHIPTVLIK